MAKKIETKDIVPITSSQSIMLEEFRGLHSDYIHQRTEGVTRVNFFITAMSVVLGGVLVFASSNNATIISYFRLILLAALMILVTIGLDVYNFLIQRDMATDRHIRGMARVRNYFVKLDPNLEDYFVNKIYDTPSGYLIAKSSGMRRSTEIVVGFLAGIFLTVLSSYFTFVLEINLAVGIGATVLTAVLLEMNARRRLEKARKNAEKETKFNKSPNAK
jgi:hypothetical protein